MGLFSKNIRKQPDYKRWSYFGVYEILRKIWPFSENKPRASSRKIPLIWFGDTVTVAHACISDFRTKITRGLADLVWSNERSWLIWSGRMRGHG